MRQNWHALPGWFCPVCKAFNGDVKEKLLQCRACESGRPPIAGDRVRCTLNGAEGLVEESYDTPQVLAMLVVRCDSGTTCAPTSAQHWKVIEAGVKPAREVAEGHCILIETSP